MPIPVSPNLKVVATWPVASDGGFDLSQPSPWRLANVAVPSSPDPLQPVLSVLFTHELAPAAFASNAAASAYLFLTSLTDPSATNITSFTDVSYDASRNLLTFRPATPLTAGSRYQATVRGTVPDSAGRLLGASYSWEFDVDPSAYQGLPIPALLTPPDRTVVVSSPPILTWGIDKTYDDLPTGQHVAFLVRIYGDAERKTVLWQGVVTPPSLDPSEVLTTVTVSGS